VNFLGACTEEPNLAMVMELMPNGSLTSLLRNTEKDLPWSMRMRMLEEIASGIKVLHGNSPTILHRDLKSPNVLLDEHWHCKLADFGFAVVKQDTTTKTGVASVGTLAWMAPELFSLKPKFSVKSDIYAFGMIMWEIATRMIPYRNVHAAVVQNGVLKGQREEIPSDCPEGYAELMEKCWDQSPAVRPNIDAVLSKIAQIKLLSSQNEDIIDAASHHLEYTQLKNDYRRIQQELQQTKGQLEDEKKSRELGDHKRAYLEAELAKVHKLFQDESAKHASLHKGITSFDVPDRAKETLERAADS